jgi:hypothetical protein
VTAQWVREKLRKAEAETAAGRMWRAKEMLRGSIGSESYALEPDLLEAYGRLLDQLGDRYEAGKFLFLSGKWDSGYGEAIELYLDRNKKASASDIIAQFPAAIRRRGLAHLPDNVRKMLEQKGADAAELERREPLSQGVRKLAWKDWLVMLIFIVTLLCGVFLCLVGFVTVMGWIF